MSRDHIAVHQEDVGFTYASPGANTGMGASLTNITVPNSAGPSTQLHPTAGVLGQREKCSGVGESSGEQSPAILCSLSLKLPGAGQEQSWGFLYPWVSWGQQWQLAGPPFIALSAPHLVLPGIPPQPGTPATPQAAGDPGIGAAGKWSHWHVPFIVERGCNLITAHPPHPPSTPPQIHPSCYVP